MIEDIGIGIGAFFLYTAVGLAATIGMGRAFMSQGMRRRLAHGEASPSEWWAFGTCLALWPVAMAISLGFVGVTKPAKLVGKITSYAFSALEGPE